jgi:hypothetical protein
MIAHAHRRRSFVIAGAVVAALVPAAVEASPIGGGPLAPGQPVCFDSGASAGESVIMNVTPVDAPAPGFGTVTVTGEDWQASSNVNFEAGGANPNLVIKQPGADGQLCYTASVVSHVIVDVLALADLGWRSATPDGSADRVVDTRPAGVLTPGQPICFDSGAAPGESVIANITPVAAWAAGFGTVTVTGEDWQASSNVNFVEDAANPNLVIKQPGPDGRLCYTADMWSDVLIDVIGYASFDSRPGAAGGGADRIVDTRAEGLREPGQPRCFDGDASAGESLVMNVTPVDAAAAGFGTVTVTGEDWQASSNVNFVVGAANPNLVIKQPGPDGRLCYTADMWSDVLIDVIGYASFDSRPGAADGGADRVVDTRQPGLLTLRADGLGPHTFGAIGATTLIPALVDLLGPTVRDDTQAFPEFDVALGLYVDVDEGFAFPFGRTVCFANGFCAQFGGATAPTVFAGWWQDDSGTSGSPLSTGGGVTIGSRWADHLGTMDVDPGGCYSTGTGGIGDIELGLRSDGVPFTEVIGGEWVENVPDPADVVVHRLSSGDRPIFLFADC